MTTSPLARHLWEARRTGTVIDAASIVLPATSEEAYGVQWEIVALSGLGVKGFKIGSTSAEAQRLLGTTEPGSAALLAPYVHESPARVPLVEAQMPAVEGEFSFRLGTALPPRAAPYARAWRVGSPARVGWRRRRMVASTLRSSRGLGMSAGWASTCHPITSP
jgi:2-keto-4-pentenoate hydratase